jgi:hypothetical protein
MIGPQIIPRRSIPNRSHLDQRFSHDPRLQRIRPSPVTTRADNYTNIREKLR